MAEKVGFEPTMQITPHNTLAGCRLQPTRPLLLFIFFSLYHKLICMQIVHYTFKCFFIDSILPPAANPIAITKRVNVTIFVASMGFGTKKYSCIFNNHC